MKHVYALAAAISGIAMATAAHAQSATPSIVVTPWVAPNVFGSPSFAQAEQNQYTGLKTGASSVGTPGTATYYQAITDPIGYGAIIATGFNSWMGNANPGAGFENELGNRIHYGIVINGNGAQFSISQLSLNFDGNGASNYFDYDFGTGYQYSPYDGSGGFVGIQKGADGILGTGDDIYITSGSDTQLVDALIGRGSGMADAVYCGAVPDTSGTCGALNQSYIDDRIAYYVGDGFTQLTGTYSLLNANGGAIATGSATVHFAATAAVPEPATWALMILGFGFVGASLRRRRVSFASA